MKKIMFNDRYGLTQAVLEGRKNMTRRIITCPREFKGEWVAGFSIRKHKVMGTQVCMFDADEAIMEDGQLLPKYKVGEVVAIAQAYNEFDIFYSYPKAGWTNKMFVKADLMPHHIQITDIKVERLQDISNEDCLKEGIYYEDEYLHRWYLYHGNRRRFINAKSAFAALIDKVSGKGTWNSNPWVWAYEFQLLRD